MFGRPEIMSVWPITRAGPSGASQLANKDPSLQSLSNQRHGSAGAGEPSPLLEPRLRRSLTTAASTCSLMLVRTAAGPRCDASCWPTTK